MTDGSGDQLVRLATRADHPAMVRVLMSAFGPWPRFPLRGSALEHLEWKLASTELHAVLVIDGELAGVSSSWHSDVRVGNELVPVNNGADFAILLNCRGVASAGCSTTSGSRATPPTTSPSMLSRSRRRFATCTR